MQVRKFTFNPWQENSYVLYDETGECVMVDMGCVSDSDHQELAEFIDDKNLTVKYIINTHLHIDHILGNYKLKETYNVPVLAHENDEFLLENAETYAEQIGFKLQSPPPAIDKYIDEGDKIAVGNFKLQVLHIPGHTPGSLVFYNAEDGILISGDVLFYESIGRTDLIYGNHAALVKGITSKILGLPETTEVYPGHGPKTTISHEKCSNPFLKHMC
ncbi:MAG TPA: MBL fold metallo-hydrolase [Salinivirga sp.]|uniref:MBL fold metallo-hydrolase n=1 Tax=Salinivirga sp. TaxID=1970192 RepID=UPI002B484070|nr:MBL fold metallo-hydrolase [Salinivirga sp.]HKK60568.1 MBL fold metallo-hydrolase [Salinivirga sp.]